MKVKNNGFQISVLVLALMGLVFAPFTAFAAVEKAPLGTYTASTGTTGGTVSGGRVGGGRFRRGGNTSGSTETGGKNVTVAITSYSTKDELTKLREAEGNIESFLNILRGFNHGSLTFEGKTSTINAASSVKVGDKYYVDVLTSSPLVTSQVNRRARQAQGAAAGYIRLNVNSDGAGSGTAFTTTQIVISTEGEITARVGASTATQLTGVTRQ